MQSGAVSLMITSIMIFIARLSIVELRTSCKTDSQP